MLQVTLASLGDKYLHLLAPHRRLRLRVSCTFSCSACSFSAMVFVLSDILLVCRRQRGELRGWLLIGLRDLLMGDEALDTDHGFAATTALISAPSSAHHVAFRINARARSLDSPERARHLQRNDTCNLYVQPSQSGSSSALGVEDELFRLELLNAEALAKVQRTLQECFEELASVDTEARRPERRLRTAHLDDKVRQLI